ncbi:MAG: PH domain-containing protein [Mariniblastus sp.]
MEIFLDSEIDPPNPNDDPFVIPTASSGKSPHVRRDEPHLAEVVEVADGLNDAEVDHAISPSELLQTSDVEQDFHHLDPRNISAERVAGLIFASIVALGMLIGAAVIWFSIGTNLVWISLASTAAVLSIAFFIYVWCWPTVAHRHSRWRLDEEGLEIRQGVYWRHQITIPLGRVQHADVSQGPLQRAYGLGTLTVNTAGTQNASVDLAGLAHENALALRDQIVRQRKDQNVV